MGGAGIAAAADCELMDVRARCGRFQEEECWLQQGQDEWQQWALAAAAAAARGESIGLHFNGALCGLHITCFRFAVAASLGAYPHFIFIPILWFALDKREALIAPIPPLGPP